VIVWAPRASQCVPWRDHDRHEDLRGELVDQRSGWQGESMALCCAPELLCVFAPMCEHNGSSAPRIGAGDAPIGRNRQ
jgi:hypothetical protein